MKNFAIKLAKEAGRIILNDFGNAYGFKEKGDRDFVTATDEKCEKRLFELINKKYPEHGIISEEYGIKEGKSDYTWILDPLDGTHNFMHNIPVCCTQIALAYKDEVRIGVIYNPILKEMYFAEKGKGAFLNGKKIHVSKKNRLVDCYVLYDSAFTRLGEPILQGVRKLRDHVFGLRMFGCAGQCFGWIASGKSEAYIEYKTTPWDIAPGALLVEEAGGMITAHDGKPWSIKSKLFIASNGFVHDKILKLILD